jgi:crotonobetainyl-CoA:carnitine CoA-transferase CaiB-like acyl-CoA transferase
MPVKFSNWPDKTDLKASKLGADNEAVLNEMLGLSSDQIAKLYADGVLLRAPEVQTAV